MVMPANASEFVRQIRTLTNDLIDALNSGDEARIQKDGQAFSVAVEHAWQYFNRPEVPAREKAIPRLIEGWAQRDLMPRSVTRPIIRKQSMTCACF
jgi:hypothetical protein